RACAQARRARPKASRRRARRYPVRQPDRARRGTRGRAGLPAARTRRSAGERADGTRRGGHRLRPHSHGHDLSGRCRRRARVGGPRRYDERDPSQPGAALRDSRPRRRRQCSCRDRGRRQRAARAGIRNPPAGAAWARRAGPRRARCRVPAGRRFPAPPHRPAERDMIRVLIAEDQAMVRGALASLLRLEDDIDVVAEVDRGDQVLAAAQRARPDIALLDIEMPGLDGISAASELARELPATRSLILTTFGRPGYMRRAPARGGGGFLQKPAPASDPPAATRAAAGGRGAAAPTLAAAALTEGESPLTAREHEVLAAAATHDTAAGIAAKLHLS